MTTTLSTVIGRIMSFGALAPNWDSFGARAVDPDCAAAAIAFLTHRVGTYTPLPTAVPTSAGTVQLEWRCNGFEIEIEFTSLFQLRFSFSDVRDRLESGTHLDTFWLMPFIELLSEHNGDV